MKKKNQKNIENSGSFWWFNGTQSDDINEDKQLVYVRIVGDDLAGLETLNSTIFHFLYAYYNRLRCC